ncbi:hypothetical protein CZ787_15390 [Halomonas citrativorans]|uniref:Uncharacterized protein n=1 Tax=Halomonas citrativorans TaxID=2742612 RepID=A0A1R4I3Q2_9GAMM|nr:hypothetical protein CZ787_15390 [Halomonas citrativorans]
MNPARLTQVTRGLKIRQFNRRYHAETFTPRRAISGVY